MIKLEKFIDTHTLTLKSGDGAPGAATFRREKFVPNGGPDGGDGGKGGDIIFIADKGVSSFQHLYSYKSIKAQNGEHGMSKKKNGRDGKDTIIKVPIGTIIKDTNNTEIIDLTEDQARFDFLKGGKGGLGNTHFATSTNQAPEYAQSGLPGKEVTVNLEIKLIADIGLVGFPNAGKSTFISALTNARPKIADYPFTTLSPKLGIWNLNEEKSLVIADIPGILEGAHKGTGLGLTFLRHIERTRFLFYIIESISNDPYDDYKKLKYELETHSKKLAKKDFIICLSKMDIYQEDVQKAIAFFPKKLRESIFPISSVRREGLNELRNFSFQINKDKTNSKKSSW